MCYQNILIHFTSDRTCLDRIALAASLSNKNRRLMGWYFQSDFLLIEQQTTEIAIAPDGLAWAPEPTKNPATIIEEDKNAIQGLLMEAAELYGPIKWTTSNGELYAHLNSACATYELAILSKYYFDGIDSRSITVTLPDLSLKLSCPLLILSENTLSDYSPKRPLIIWDGSVESVRAIKQALPILKRCEQCAILSNDDESSDSEVETPREISAMLSAWGINTTQFHHEPEDGDLANTIESLAHDKQYDLLVFGYSGESFFQKVFGENVLNNIIDNTNIPIFLGN